MSKNSLDIVKLNESAINSALTGSYWRVLTFDEVASTQTELLTRNLSHGSVCVAEYQSAGRGRLDRKFQSNKYLGLTFSFVYQSEVNQERLGLFPLIVGSAIADLLTELTNQEFKVKWPNDVITNSDKKILGILTTYHQGKIHCGVGINVNSHNEDLPVPTATSLLIETGKSWNRNILLVEILQRLGEKFAQFEAGVDQMDFIRAQSATIGKFVEISLPGGSVIQGKVADIKNDGQLVLTDGKSYQVADIIHLNNA